MVHIEHLAAQEAQGGYRRAFRGSSQFSGELQFQFINNDECPVWPATPYGATQVPASPAQSSGSGYMFQSAGERAAAKIKIQPVHDASRIALQAAEESQE